MRTKTNRIEVCLNDADYAKFQKAVMRVGNNQNQLARAAHAFGIIDTKALR